MQKTVKIAIYALAVLAGTIWIVNGATVITQRLSAINAQAPIIAPEQN